MATFDVKTPPGSAAPVVYVRVPAFGSRDEVHRPATEDDKRRFNAAYRAFLKAGEPKAPPPAPPEPVPYLGVVELGLLGAGEE